jgi:hypothetical protein
MKSRSGVALFSCLVLLLVAVALVASACGGGGEEATPTPTPTATPTEAAELKSYRNPEYPEGYQNPLPHLTIPQHPFLAPNEKSNFHKDAYMTDTHEVSGPLGLNPIVKYVSYGDFEQMDFEMPVTIAFDSKGRIVAGIAGSVDYKTSLIDRDTFEELASYPHPPRHKDWPKDPLYPYRDTSGGVYFMLDSQDRVLFATFSNTVQIIQYVEDKGEFELVREYNLRDHLAPVEPPVMDHVQMAIPDWEGRHFWFATRYGKVGTIDPDSGEIRSIELTGEEIENSLTVGEDGVYIVSDHAMYRFHAGEDGIPIIDWRTEYDRGTRLKPSMMSQGSGQTPTLLADLVVIGDNAEPRMNILFLKRSDGSLVDKIPVFPDGLSASGTSVVGLAREGSNGTEYSVMLDNHYGIKREFMFMPGGICTECVGGVTRVDLIPNTSGGYICKEVWTNPEISGSGMPTLSLASGLLYLCTYEPLPDDNYGWAFTAVDFETGETVFKVPIGIGAEYMNMGPDITLDPDGGKAYFGVLGGLVIIQDGTP